MLKKLLGASALLSVSVLSQPVLADGFTSTIQDSVGISVQGAAVQTTRMGTSYAVSGVNVEAATATTAIGLSEATRISGATAAFVPVPTAFNIVNPGQDFSLSEKVLIGDAIVTPSAVSSGQVAPVTYGTITTQVGGDIGSATATINTVGQSMAITGGGIGTTVTAGRTVSLTAF